LELLNNIINECGSQNTAGTRREELVIYFALRKDNTPKFEDNSNKIGF